MSCLVFFYLRKRFLPLTLSDIHSVGHTANVEALVDVVDELNRRGHLIDSMLRDAEERRLSHGLTDEQLATFEETVSILKRECQSLEGLLYESEEVCCFEKHRARV